jgi:energy-coupling factor transporter ATP-binding protein EcfA2
MGSFEIKDLTFSYPGSDRLALDHLNLTIQTGDFVVLCGRSGCGKSTLLRHLKTVLAPHGKKEGEILFDGTKLEELDLRAQASQIGYVLQNPDNQIVTDKVWHELAFGLESLGYDNSAIRLRVAEMASFFGIQSWFLKNVTELSGGQKQLLNLASIMAMQPSVLILDEPTSQLDPIAASEFLETVKKINRELGTTVIISEHRLDEILPAADRVAVLDRGALLCYEEPSKAGSYLKQKQHEMFLAMPAPVQIYAGVPNSLPCPLTVRDGRNWLSGVFEGKEVKQNSISEEHKKTFGEPVIQMKEVWFKYEKKGQDIVKDLSLSVKKGEWYSIVGGNGTGKTTTLSLISRINRPYRGKVLLNGKEIGKYSDNELFSGLLGVLPQNPQALFVKKTVELDLLEILSQRKLSKEEKLAEVHEMAKLVEIEELLQMHPYDLSGGEQQRAALGKVLLLRPKILLLDEPTKGIDGFFKTKLAEILKKLQQSGVTIVMVSHDIEFCAKYTDTCAMFFNGNIVTSGETKPFFAGNSFYTTSANRMARHLFPDAVTNEDVIELCRKNL